MNSERRRVLEMLAEGKISAGDAERLLERLGNGTGETGRDEPGDTTVVPTGKLKYLRVVVDDKDGDQVNIRVPLVLIRTGLKLSTMLPRHASEKLSEKGINISQLSGLQGEELIEALRELQVHVDSSKGEKVRIFCE